MEIRAKLSVRPTKKGVAGEISWTDEEGNSKRMSVPSGVPLTLEMDGTECKVKREGGQIVSLEVEGRDLMAQRRPAPPKPKKKSGFGQRKSPPPGSPPPHSHSPGRGKSNGEIYNVSMAKLPVDTVAVLANDRKIENFHLQLNKAAPFVEDGSSEKGKFYVYHQDKRKNIVVRFDPTFSQELIKSIWRRQEQSIKTIGVPFAELEAKIDWRLVVGLGGASVYETSLTLHHLYGIPYIPGSALKGVTRSCYIIENYGQNKDSEETALKDSMFQKIFGHPKLQEKEAHKGFVVFHDAFPVPGTPPKIVPDVMNPHYGDYYSKDKPPADYLSPVPVTFLTVENATFRFYLSVHDRDGQLKSNSETDKVLATAKKWLQKALSEFGVGAKTAVGYGYMNVES